MVVPFELDRLISMTRLSTATSPMTWWRLHSREGSPLRCRPWLGVYTCHVDPGGDAAAFARLPILTHSRAPRCPRELQPVPAMKLVPRASGLGALLGHPFSRPAPGAGDKR